MSKTLLAGALVTLGGLCGCASYNVGSNHEPDGSYQGSTLNSSVTDQNPHAGGDSSYPTSGDAGKPEQPVEKTNY